MRAFLLSAIALTLAAGLSAQTLEETQVSRLKAVTSETGETWKDLGEGEFSDFIVSNIARGNFNDPVKVMIQESEQTPGRYRLVNPWPSLTDNPELNFLIVDASDPDFVTIPEHLSPVDDPDRGETWFCSCTYMMTELKGYSKDFLKENDFAWIPKVKDGVINFTTTSLAVMWPDNPYGDVGAGEWTYSNMEYTGYIKLPGAQGEDEWKSLGTGRMLEGAVWPAFELDIAPVEKDVEIFESITHPGTYRIAGAFTDISPKTARDLVIDASDPDFCRIRKQNIGVQTVDYGWTYILSVSTNGVFADYEDMVAQYPDWAGRNITMDENGFHIPRTSILLFFPDYDDVNVLVVSNSIDSYIWFPGKNGIDNITSVENDETQYYNLQGFRVMNPRKGQIVIGRRGSETFKTVVR